MAKHLLKVVDKAGEPLPAFIYLNGQGVAAANELGEAELEAGFYEVRALGYKPTFVSVPESSFVSLELDEGADLPEVEIVGEISKKKGFNILLLLILILIISKS